MVGGLSWSYVGPSCGYVGPFWGYVGPSWGDIGPSWSHVGPSWGYVGPSWGLCWPILRPMLAQVDPSWATRSGNGKKMRRAQNTVKRGTFWRPGVSAAGAAAPLSYGEERNAFGKDTARGPLAGLKGSRPLPLTPDSLFDACVEQIFVVFLSWELRTDILLQWLCCWVVVWLRGFVVASKATFDLCMICSWIGFRWRSALNRIKSFNLPHSRTTLHTDKEWKNNELNRLKPGYCLQNAGKVFGKGAAGHLKAG